MRTLSLAVVFVAAALVATAAPSAACDPEWDWCGWDAWDVWDAPVYDEPAWIPLWEPAYEPEPLAPAPWYEPPAPVAAWVPPPAAAPIAYEPVDGPAVYEPVYQAPVYQPPTYEAPVFEPVAYAAPVYDPPPAPAAPSSAWIDPGYDETPASVAPPAVDEWVEAARIGAHRVTDTYLSETVTTDGRTTVFGTTTLHQDAETAARAVATVGTGEASGFESVLWNGRNRRSDGSLVRGTVYENFVWNGVAWVHDKYVFFQDDAETAPLAPDVSPLPIPPPPPPPPPRVPLIPFASAPSVAVTAPPGIGSVDPVATAAPVLAADPSSAPLLPAGAPAHHDVRAGIALAPEADVLPRIEVLRGRPVPLWARALVDGAPGRVTSWRFGGGEVTAIGPLSGTGDDPFTAMWEQVSPPGSAFALTLDVAVDVPGEGSRTVSGTITVVVRSPAIVE